MVKVPFLFDSLFWLPWTLGSLSVPFFRVAFIWFTPRQSFTLPSPFGELCTHKIIHLILNDDWNKAIHEFWSFKLILVWTCRILYDLVCCLCFWTFFVIFHRMVLWVSCCTAPPWWVFAVKKLLIRDGHSLNRGLVHNAEFAYFDVFQLFHTNFWCISILSSRVQICGTIVRQLHSSCSNHFHPTHLVILWVKFIWVVGMMIATMMEGYDLKIFEGYLESEGF